MSVMTARIVRILKWWERQIENEAADAQYDRNWGDIPSAEDVARCIIEAIREPSPAMILAGVHTFGATAFSGVPVWQDMIDAELAEARPMCRYRVTTRSVDDQPDSRVASSLAEAKALAEAYVFDADKEGPFPEVEQQWFRADLAAYTGEGRLETMGQRCWGERVTIEPATPSETAR